MGKTKLDREIYPDNYYLRETSNSQHYGNILLTSMKKMEGNICIDITFKDGSAIPNATYSLATVNDYRYIILTPSAQLNEGWVNGGTIFGNSLVIPLDNVVVKQNTSVKSTLSTSTIYPDTGKYFYTVTVNPLSLQTKTITPSSTVQIVTASSNYDGLSKVVVNPISNPFTIPVGTYTITTMNSDEIDTWESKTWQGYTNFTGNHIWNDGKNIYYSYTAISSSGIISRQYVLDKETNTWVDKTWNINNIDSSRIWKDGDNVYYSSSSSNYILNKETSTWEEKTWNNIPTNFSGNNIWTDGENIYYSQSSNQYVLNRSNDTWEEKTWGILTSFNGSDVWTDGENIYYSKDDVHRKLNKTNSNWNTKIWYNLPSNFVRNRIWTDGKNIYYSNGGSTHYILNKETSTWYEKTWYDYGDTNIYGYNIWTDGENVYHSNGENTHYRLDMDDKKIDIGNYKYIYVPTENITVTPTSVTQTITPTSGKVIKEVFVPASSSGASGNTIITQQIGFNVSSYATADVTPSSITTSGYPSTTIITTIPTSWPYYISISEGWIDECNIIEIYDTKLISSNVKKDVTICYVSGTYVPAGTTYSGSYVTGTST